MSLTSRGLSIDAFELGFTYPTRHRLQWRRFGFGVVHQRFDAALQGINLSIGRGNSVGIIGRNGSGKSTLVKVLSGVLPPTTGLLRVKGSIASLVELGAGFDPELSLHDNILLYGSLLGRSTSEMRSQIHEILDWAELGPFEWNPVRTLSSGMTARLAFAIATGSAPDILLVDEVLSVGDAKFRERSRARINGILNRGGAVLLVSHDLISIRELTQRCIWLERGRIKLQGDPVEVTDAYMLQLMQEENSQ